MRQDTRLSRLLHVLLHMSEHDGPMTSQQIADMLATNPVVVRRIMAGLREAGYVAAERGHGGGWTLTRTPSEITLRDVYQCLGSPDLFAFGLSNPDPQCLVERSVNATIRETVENATQAILARFGDIRLSDIEQDFQIRREQRTAHSTGAIRGNDHGN
ncbi:Rrf2 family transcriptional regulator [Puniceibacterium sp. IMCC21224]|uniref:Rrf2 family transcriptional regulator n=1 Tax=Puniceibacterium sp. IMCC21224 TaxID=1618204 RepID=UPI00064DC4F6|nr:Rrf2 family transcriptional regulator [Puniceibacterium sp. IMCC21224]KMK68305.1 putative transcriptional regulator [Puniceibacterium sp. IMCC21224]